MPVSVTSLWQQRKDANCLVSGVCAFLICLFNLNSFLISSRRNTTKHDYLQTSSLIGLFNKFNRLSDSRRTSGLTSGYFRLVEMDSPHVGVVRDSMNNNPLIKKAKLGKTKSKGVSCPGPDFVYGAATTFQDGGVAEALSNWHTPSPSFSSSAWYGKAERDFVALNREGIKSGLVTAKELQQYHATHDIRRPVFSKSFKSAPPQIPQDITFGLPTCRPSSPISALLEYKYGQRWLEEQQARDRALLDHQNKKLVRNQDTRTTLLRKTRPLKEPPTMWKLPRFQQTAWGQRMHGMKISIERRVFLRCNSEKATLMCRKCLRERDEGIAYKIKQTKTTNNTQTTTTAAHQVLVVSHLPPAKLTHTHYTQNTFQPRLPLNLSAVLKKSSSLHYTEHLRSKKLDQLWTPSEILKHERRPWLHTTRTR
ncbi:cilia- and flagella-associated protein 77 isoform X2 [Ictalurus furcatus]|uniref:cilia- and flagella-associated protein 77 isoform X2 n=1 Tax=Ictalurus furcatus TaxID=66913 RepID=UPI0023505643|nr:cilia- and flagella-associated protein 77 isoform X2 [Ictalurus furcatus]